MSEQSAQYSSMEKELARYMQKPGCLSDDQSAKEVSADQGSSFYASKFEPSTSGDDSDPIRRRPVVSVPPSSALKCSSPSQPAEDEEAHDANLVKL